MRSAGYESRNAKRGMRIVGCKLEAGIAGCELEAGIAGCEAEIESWDTNERWETEADSERCKLNVTGNGCLVNTGYCVPIYSWGLCCYLYIQIDPQPTRIGIPSLAYPP